MVVVFQVVGGEHAVRFTDVLDRCLYTLTSRSSFRPNQDSRWLTDCIMSTNTTQICKFDIKRKKASLQEIGARIDDLYRIHTSSGKAKQVTMCAVCIREKSALKYVLCHVCSFALTPAQTWSNVSSA